MKAERRACKALGNAHLDIKGHAFEAVVIGFQLASEVLQHHA